jgi:ferredoxin--NADP+ reductase
MAAATPAPTMSAAFIRETVLDVRHWTPDYFSFTTSRDDGFRFDNGQFVMLGLEVEGRPLLRAYSIASANWEEQLEFFSIKVPNGPLTSRLQHIQARRRGAAEPQADRHAAGQRPAAGAKPLPARHRHRAWRPFLAVIKDPETYERFDRVIVTHGVRRAGDLCYADYIRRELPHHEFLGEQIARQLLYYPAVTREEFVHRGRLTTLLDEGRMAATWAWSRSIRRATAS